MHACFLGSRPEATSKIPRAELHSVKLRGSDSSYLASVGKDTGQLDRLRHLLHCTFHVLY